MEKRGLWCGSSEAGKTAAEVRVFVDRIADAGFNLLLVHLKGGDGLVYWPSKRFPQTVAPGYAEFDLPAALLEACRARGVELHAWFIDYYEGLHGAAYREHPEWAATDAHGRSTANETLRGKRYDAIWMCPARGPGYTDQWLVPLIEEFASMYDFDGVHHDYIRYPGDLAPDQYCFCDYCLEHLPKWAGYLTESYPEEPFYHEFYDRPYLEAHWEQSPRVLPKNWDRLDRYSKSRFLLEGSFFQGGRYDLDYFFYSYRVHWIIEFARMAREAVDSARPGMRISAAVFKNPIHSGRFLGQDWRRFAGHVDDLLPMDYRDHYPGDFETYLTLLKESIRQQKEWARGFGRLMPGFAINFLYFEEERALRSLRDAIAAGDREAGRSAAANLLNLLGSDNADAVTRWLDGGSEPHSLAVSEGYWPDEKFTRVVEAIRECGVDGLAVFSESQLDQFGVWGAAKQCLDR